jgi:hypothetical protein
VGARVATLRNTLTQLPPCRTAARSLRRAGRTTAWLDSENSHLGNARDNLAALGLVVAAGFAVAIVGIASAVEPVVVGAGS